MKRIDWAQAGIIGLIVAVAFLSGYMIIEAAYSYEEPARYDTSCRPAGMSEVPCE